jgi:hypothetical protein
MNRNHLLLSALPASMWQSQSNIQIAERYDIPRPFVRRFRKEQHKPAQPRHLKSTATHHPAH